MKKNVVSGVVKSIETFLDGNLSIVTLRLFAGETLKETRVPFYGNLVEEHMGSVVEKYIGRVVDITTEMFGLQNSRTVQTIRTSNSSYSIPISSSSAEERIREYNSAKTPSLFYMLG